MTSSFSLCKFSERPALPQKIGNQQIPRFLPRWRWFRHPVLRLDVAGLYRMDARDVSSRWISACWISTSQRWFWSSLSGRNPQMINQFIETIVPSIDKHWQATPTKITNFDMKNRKNRRITVNCSRLTLPNSPDSIGKSSSHPSDARISFEDLSTYVHQEHVVRCGPGHCYDLICCGLLWSLVMLRVAVAVPVAV